MVQKEKRHHGRLGRTSTLGTIGAWLLLILYLSPMYLVISIALKSKEDFAKNGFALPEKIVWSNLKVAAEKMELAESATTSIIVTVVSIALILLFSAWASYSMSRRRKKFYNGMYIFFLAGMMIPFQLVMLPLYKLINGLGLMGTYASVICIYVGCTIPLAIIIFTGFIKTIPRELDEAAIIDGASPTRIFWSIILPLIRAPLVTVMIMCLVNFWNDLLTPLLFFGSKHETLMVSLYNFKGAHDSTDWTMVFAGSLVAMLPLLIVFLISQKHFIKGMVSGAVKG